MKHLRWLIGLGVLLGGCIIPYDDPAAAEAVAHWNAGAGRDLPRKPTLAQVLLRLPWEKSYAARREFARLRRARELAELYRNPLRADGLRSAVLDGECARIRLNALLGVRPEVRLDYDTSDAFAVPEELPDPDSAAKAALLNRDPAVPPEAALTAVALAHARAVAAYDAAAHAATPEARIDRQCARTLALLDLAEALNLPCTALGEVEALAGRFDTVKRHRDVTFR